MSVVVVSWVLVLLAAFGMNYAHDVIGEARLIQVEIDRHQLRAWARSGVELAGVTLEHTPRVDCAALGYSSPDNLFSFPLACGQGRFAVGKAYAFDDQGSWRPGIEDEAGRLPVAIADSTTLAALPGMTPHGIEAILQAKETAGAQRLPPFNMLPHIDEASRDSAEHYLSRYGNAVNVNSASREVLLAVGVPPRAADKLLGWRSGTDEILGNSDDQRFQGLDGNDRGIRACALNNEEATVLAYLVGAKKLAVESSFFRLVSRSWGDGFSAICEIRVVLEKQDQGPVKVMEWTENWLN